MSVYGPMALGDFGRQPEDGSTVVRLDGFGTWRRADSTGTLDNPSRNEWQFTGALKPFSWQRVLDMLGATPCWIITPESGVGADEAPTTTAGTIPCDRCGELIPLPVEIVSNDAAGIVANITTDDLELHQLTHECEL